MSKPQPYLDAGEKSMKKLIGMAKNEESKRLIPIFRKKVMEHHNELHNCPFCSMPIDDIVVNYATWAGDLLKLILEYTNKIGKHEFQIDKMKDYFGSRMSPTQYANMNHMTRFAGIIYRPMNQRTGKRFTSKYYGVNRERLRDFINGATKAPIRIVADRFSREREEVIEGYIHEFPRMSEFLDEDGIYHPNKTATLPV